MFQLFCYIFHVFSFFTALRYLWKINGELYSRWTMKAKCILTYFTFHVVIRCTHKKNRILRSHRQSFVSVDCCRFFSCMLCLRCPFTIHTRFVNEFLSFLFSFILICVNNKRTMSYLQFVVFVLTIFQQCTCFFVNLPFMKNLTNKRVEKKHRCFLQLPEIRHFFSLSTVANFEWVGFYFMSSMKNSLPDD